jgi:ribosome maturation protein SDO1
MVSLDEAVTARIEKQGMHFEVLIDPKAAEDFLDGKPVDLVGNLATDLVFKDASKGTKASEEALAEAFGTTELEPVVTAIVKHGDIQLTTQQRRDMQKRKHAKIVNTIIRTAMNPQTKLPHPKERIELAMEEARFHVDPFKPVDLQVKEVIDAIKTIIPISTDNVHIKIRIPPKFSGRAYGEIKAFGTMLSEAWLNDGSYQCVLELPAGMQTDLYDTLNGITHGNVETEIVS